MANLNDNLTAPLAEMAKIKRGEGDTFRAAAYTKAVAALKGHPKKIESGAEARKIKGIGEGIAGRIQEIIDTGTLEELQALRGGQAVAEQLMRVPGIGPVAARRLVEVEGVRSLDDLRAIGRCEGPAGHAALERKLTHQQRVGLKYFEELERRVPRAEVAEFEAAVRREAAALDPRYHVEAVGSYRRGLPDSGDIDLLVTHPHYPSAPHGNPGDLLDRLVGRLVQAGLVTDVVSQGPVLFSGVAQLAPERSHRHLDVKLFPTESLPTALLHFTGSGPFNEQTRSYAKSIGFKLSEYGLFPVDAEGHQEERVPVRSEADVFRALGLPYRAPEERSV